MILEVRSKHNLDFRSTATIRSNPDLKNWNTKNFSRLKREKNIGVDGIKRRLSQIQPTSIQWHYRPLVVQSLSIYKIITTNIIKWNMTMSRTWLKSTRIIFWYKIKIIKEYLHYECMWIHRYMYICLVNVIYSSIRSESKKSNDYVAMKT